MTAVGQDDTLYAGEDRTLRYRCRELNDAGADVGALDLTGATLVWQSGLLRKTVGAGLRVVAPATGGVVEVDLVPADTAGVTVRTSRAYELRATDASSKVSTLARGRYTVEPTLVTP